MRSLIQKITSSIAYHLQKKGPHGIHSPFVFEFSTKVLHNRKDYPAYAVLEKAKKLMLSNRNQIETVDFGAAAGNKQFATYLIRVNKLAKNRMISMKYYQLLYRIVAFYKPNNILEFGTSTGMSAASIALANPESKIITMEGCASVAQVAQSVFNRLDINNISLSIGNFNHVLAANLEQVNQLDLVFFDGNHRKEPTLDYFNHCLTKAGENSIFIFDDIHWSAEMEEAWKSICQNAAVTLSIDLYQYGIVFFRNGVEKQHFVLSI